MPALPDVHVLIAGEGPERRSLLALAQAEGVAERLHLPGWRADTAALLAAADLLVCPSRHEPLGNVVHRSLVRQPSRRCHHHGRAARADHRRRRRDPDPARGPWRPCRRRQRLVERPRPRKELGRSGPCPLLIRIRRGACRGALAAVPRHRGEALMCGIAGLILAPGAPPPDPAMLSRLIDTLEHRGPDGTGHAVVGRVALVHNRLAIIDLITGDQPLFAGPATLVCNGEIYNYRELRVAMPGVTFATNSDCEPPLHLWLREGADYAQHLRGMYAIAIHERVQRTVTLTRDRIRHQAALHRADRQRPGLRLRAAGAAGSRPRPPHRPPGGARGAAATAVHHGHRNDLRGHPAPAARRNDDLRRRPHPRSPPRLAHSRGRPREHRRGRGAGCVSIARWRKASICTSAADVPYGMFLLRRYRQFHAARDDGAPEQPAGAGLHRRLRRPRCRGRTRARRDRREGARREARIDRDQRTDGLAASARDRWLHGRSRGGLCDHPDLVPRPACAQGREGRAERRGRRRDLRRLRPLPQRHAALVARRPNDVGARQLRPRGRAAVASRRPGATASPRRKSRPRKVAVHVWRPRRPRTWPTGCRTTFC